MCAEKRTAPSEKLSMLVYRFPSISGRRLKRRFRKVKATEAIRSDNLLDNAAIAELLIREAETKERLEQQGREILEINAKGH